MNKKITIDITMMVLLPFLMAYSLIGEGFHEISGTLMLILFVCHHILNIGFFKGLFHGRYNAKRIFLTGIDLVLLVIMAMQIISGILMSKHLYTFMSLGSAAAMRDVHLLFAYWGFVLMCVHAGVHLEPLVKRVNKLTAFTQKIVKGIFACLCLYGCYAFVKRQLIEYMLLRTRFVFFDLSEPKILFFLDYIAIMALFAIVGLVLSRLLTIWSRRKLKIVK
ncbi:MAG: DUF4405 domain-containing protein [Clostridia bacterium]|nr:DUF4405 domain-containing protein [Clostridia bacterium]